VEKALSGLVSMTATVAVVLCHIVPVAVSWEIKSAARTYHATFVIGPRGEWLDREKKDAGLKPGATSSSTTLGCAPVRGGASVLADGFGRELVRCPSLLKGSLRTWTGPGRRWDVY